MPEDHRKLSLLFKLCQEIAQLMHSVIFELQEHGVAVAGDDSQAETHVLSKYIKFDAKSTAERELTREAELEPYRLGFEVRQRITPAESSG